MCANATVWPARAPASYSGRRYRATAEDTWAGLSATTDETPTSFDSRNKERAEAEWRKRSPLYVAQAGRGMRLKFTAPLPGDIHSCSPERYPRKQNPGT